MKRRPHASAVAQRAVAEVEFGGSPEDRRNAIVGHIEAIGREHQAEFLATKTDEPIAACILMLASQPTDTESTGRRIAAHYLAGRRQ